MNQANHVTRDYMCVGSFKFPDGRDRKTVTTI